MVGVDYIVKVLLFADDVREVGRVHRIPAEKSLSYPLLSALAYEKTRFGVVGGNVDTVKVGFQKLGDKRRKIGLAR